MNKKNFIQSLNLQFESLIIVIDGFGLGGAQRNLLLLINQWIKLGIKVHLILIQDTSSKDLLKKLNINQNQIHLLNAKHMFDLKKFYELRNLLKTSNAPVISNLFWSQIWCFLSFFTLGSLKNKRVLIWVEHNTYLKRARLHWKLFEKFSEKVNLIICVSDEVKNYLNSKKIFNTKVIYNAIENNTKSISKFRKNDFIFLGRLVEQKQPHLAIEAFNLALQRDLVPQNSKLYIIGDGPLKFKLEERFIDLIINNKIKFLGYLDYLEIESYLLNARCLINTSMYEGFPLSRYEGLSNGVCIVSTDTAGLDFLRANLNGYKNLEEIGIFIVDDNALKLAIALGKSLQRKYWVDKLVSTRKHFVIKFKPDTIAKEYLTTVNEVRLK